MEYVRYYDPVPGVDGNGDLVTCTHVVLVSIPDVIKIQRRLFNARGMAISDQGLIYDFIVTHWAERVTYNLEESNESIRKEQ